MSYTRIMTLKVISGVTILSPTLNKGVLLNFFVQAFEQCVRPILNTKNVICGIMKGNNVAAVEVNC